jgi:hypothetical protein
MWKRYMSFLLCASICLSVCSCVTLGLSPVGGVRFNVSLPWSGMQKGEVNRESTNQR